MKKILILLFSLILIFILLLNLNFFINKSKVINIKLENIESIEINKCK